MARKGLIVLVGLAGGLVVIVVWYLVKFSAYKSDVCSKCQPWEVCQIAETYPPRVFCSPLPD